MAEMNRDFCNQAVEYCGRRASRHADSFKVRMMHGFEDGVSVPCKYTQKLNRTCEKHWMVACCQDREYDFYLRKLPHYTEMCGPYWRSFVRVHNVQLGDVVRFIYVEDEEVFYCSVYHIVDNQRLLKENTSEMVLHEVQDDIRETIHNIASHSMRNITEVEMTSILFSIMKEIYGAPAKDLADGDFYVPAKEIQFIVEKYTTENVDDGCLYFPAFAVRGLNMPGFGPTRMYHKNLINNPHFLECEYLINGDDNTGTVTLHEVGWTDMAAAIHARVGYVLVAKLHVRSPDRIFLQFGEVVNLLNQSTQATLEKFRRNIYGEVYLVCF